ncbi:MAG: MATE family efflux transporter [Treponema sp.]|nr:MATE family efflux transporter [Treponema sp.]
MKNNQINMTEGSILGKLLQFSIPLIFSNLLQLLFNAADVVVVGRYAGYESLAAVGSTGSLINLLINLFTGLSIGTNVVASHFFGAGKSKELQDTVHTAILLSFLSGIILTVVGIFGATFILSLMQCPPEVLELAATYLRIYFAGITATMVYNFGSALLRSKGDTLRTLFILFLAGIINLLLNLLFVIKFNMGVSGVAYATVISQSLSAVSVIIILLTEQDDFHLNIRKLKLTPQILAKIVKVGLPAGFQGIMFSFSNVIIQSSVNSFGKIMIAGNSAVVNIEGFIYTSMNGFSQGGLTFCSQNAGAKKPERIKKVVWTAQASIIVIGGVMSAAAYIFGRPLIGIFTKEPDVIEAGMIRLAVIMSTYFLCGMMDSMANIIRGIGHSLMPVISSLSGACIFRIIWLFTIFRIQYFHTPTVIFLSYPISWILTFIVNLIFYRKYIKEFEEKLAGSE